MRQDFAETCALKVLTWLVGNDDLFPVFLGSTGAGADELRDRAGDPDFLAAVLDFLTMDDAWVTQFAQETGCDPLDPMRARAGLPGGTDMHWT